MKNYFIILTLLCYYSAHSQLKGYYESGSTSLSIDTVRGMYNGKCILWDKNGRKRIEGHYTNNQKSGNWTAWDTLGNVLMRAKFQNSYQFTNLELYNLDGLKMKRLSDTDFLQKIYNDSIAKERRRREWSTVTMEQIMAEKREREARRPNDSFGYIEYLLERDSSGVITYPYVDDDDVAVGALIFRFIEPSETNAYLFDKNNLFEGIKRYIKSEPTTEVYTSFEFVTKMETSEVLSQLEKTQAIAGYKIKEYYYFDKGHLGSSIRILGICPLVLNTVSQTYDELFWVFYPAMRETLAILKIEFKGNPEIQTLEDILHFRIFNGFIYFREHVTEKETEINLYRDYERLKKDSIKYDEILLYFDWIGWTTISLWD